MPKRHKTLTFREAKELRMIEQLQRLNCYDGLVKRLSEGFSTPEVSRWAMSLTHRQLRFTTRI